MKTIKFFLTIILISTGMLSVGQIKAVTETGDEVLLFTNGTWKYKDTIKNNENIITNNSDFAKPRLANFLLKSNISNVGFWLNSKKWNFEKGGGANNEYSFSLKENNSIIATVIVEPINMELGALRKFALENIQKQATMLTIRHEEYRYVNGLQVLLLECDAVVQGINFSYFNYYYADTSSTVQFMGIAPTRLVAKNRSSLEELLNGFVVLGANSDSGKEIIQSSLVANSNCKALFKGTWSYVANGKKYMDVIENGRMQETSVGDNYKTVYKMEWLSNCTYVLRMQSSNEPSAQLMKMGAPITVEITEIDAGEMRYQLKYGESIMSGQMKKEK